MNANQYAHLNSEVETLKSLLNEIPEENVIDRMGLEFRLEEAAQLLEKTNPYHINKKAKLTFRGSPVIGSEAISASFATKATNLFSEAIAAISAGFSGHLHARGPIPGRNTNQLLITGTAVGSFGFEFELPRPDESDLCPNHSIIEKAVDEVRQLFEKAALGSDDELIDIVEEVHPRAIQKVHEFLEFLDEQNSWCGLEFNDHYFKFSNHTQLEKAAGRLKDENIHEVELNYSGLFQGIMPDSRTFEFKTSIDGEIIKGKIDKDIPNPEAIGQNWFFQPVIVKLTSTRIGNSSPKFVLKALADIKSR